MTNREIKAFTKGTHNKFDDEIIHEDAFSDSLGWITNDGAIELARGRKLLGDNGTAGSVSDVHTGYRVDGTAVYFKKSGTTIKVLVGDTWTDVITGLTEDAKTSFANYSSLAGAFVFVFSRDGVWKIITANPTTSTDMYDEAKNFKGIAFIDKGRTILWDREQDRTGVYGSKIDPQNSTVYTAVSSEATTSLSGTLVFKAGGATRTCFAVAITLTGTGEVYSDNYNGGLTGSLGGTGTINYATGAYTISNTGVGTANYQWENSNVNGVTDFNESVPRVAAEGFQYPHDIGGDAIKVIVPLDDTYFSFKEKSVYALTILEPDTDATSSVFRINTGVPTSKAVAATSKGIIYIDTINNDDPVIKLLARNITGDNFDTAPIFPHFDFSKYLYSDSAMVVYGDYVLIACRTKDSDSNDRILMCDYVNNTVDILPYQAKSFTQYSGNLYTGDSLSTSVYQILNGFDDLTYIINNYAISKGDTYASDSLKKVKRLRFRGLISKEQNVQVYGSFDRATYALLGTINGKATYVDTENPNTVGLNLIGADVVGGSDSEIAYPYFCELKIKTPKFRKRHFKFIATGYGFVSIKSQNDTDIWIFEEKMPKAFRQKQNISLDGATTDVASSVY